MEDILASIRRILAEDTSGSEQDSATPTSQGLAKPPGDVLEELDLAEPDAPSPPPMAEPARKPAAFEPERPIRRQEASNVFVLTPEMRAPPEAPVVSRGTAETSVDVLTQLAKAILDRRDIAVGSRDVTLEGMVREILRPLLREWLDRNLPYLIERLVKKEIDLMVNRAERLDS